jgi:hypothetical protein
MQQETLTVKFGGQSHQVEIQTFAYSVLNFATVVKQTNLKLGGRPLDIHIKAPKEGSVLVDLITTLTQNNSLIPDSVDFIANIVESVGGLYALHGFISGRKIKRKERKENKIEVELEGGSTMQVAEQIYNIYVTEPAISNGISQHFSALNEDPAVSDFAVATSNKEKIIEVNREDFPRLAIKQQFETENSRTLIESATLYIYKVVFDKTDRKWEFYYGGNRISASISDDNFFKLVDSGESFAKGDQLKVDLQINQILDESVGIHVNQSYQVIKVHEHIKRNNPVQLPFDKKLGE